MRLWRPSVCGVLAPLLTAASLTVNAQDVSSFRSGVEVLLESREWQIVSYYDGVKLVSPDLTTPDFRARMEGRPDAILKIPPPFITFGNTKPSLSSGSSIGGSAGCGGLIGKYKIIGHHLELYELGYWLAGWCTDGHRKQNDLIINALTGNRTVEISGELVTLRNGFGVIQVELEPRGFET